MLKNKKYIILFLIVFLPLFSFGQTVETDSYKFMNQENDSITYYGHSKQDFLPLYKKFRSMIISGKQQINILHIGDSHLQADLFTGQARKDFQQMFIGLEGSRGMITPYLNGGPDSYRIKFSSGWNSFNLLNTNQSKNNGLWGTTAYTNNSDEKIEINVNGKNPIKYDFNSFRIYHSDLTDDDNIILEDINVAYQKTYNKEKGYTEFNLSDYVKEVKVNISKQSQGTFYVYGFYFNNSDAGVVYNVTGTNGVTAKSYLDADLFLKQLATIDFDMIIVSLGTNDTYEEGGENTFSSHLTSLVENIHRTYPTMPILLTTPTECWWHKRKINPRQTITNEIIHNVAKQTSCAVLDLYNIMGGENSANKMVRNKLMQKDKVHLTAKGYQIEGDLLYNAVWKEIEKNLF
ncbi:MAG: GDSL-type esterase/lipase family protein [Bacteroidales bacterium]|jgi:lysophospholipase L1-like esterase|nr:GDSL-type esterase/lipase family protein [Bacteroidales bacterium]